MQPNQKASPVLGNSNTIRSKPYALVSLHNVFIIVAYNIRRWIALPFSKHKVFCLLITAEVYVLQNHRHEAIPLSTWKFRASWSCSYVKISKTVMKRIMLIMLTVLYNNFKNIMNEKEKRRMWNMLHVTSSITFSISLLEPKENIGRAERKRC